jgi:hippurate hydrolase
MRPIVVPEGLVARLTAFRRDLHAYPELGYEERRTAHQVAERLREIGAEVATGVGRTGLVGTLRRTGRDRSIGLRADMDALPLTELSGLPHRSRNEGRMHACGHDGHTAMLLGAAEVLARRPDWRGCVHFIFQPAEESGAGARAMLDDGLIERFPMQQVYALHNWPALETGQFHVRDGVMMAGSDTFQIGISGRGGHAAMPHQATDVIVAGGALVQALQTLVARNTDPQQAAVISVTRFNAGQTTNVLPERAELAGTVRTFTADVRAALEEGMRRVCRGIEAAFGVGIAVDYQQGYPPTCNSDGPVALCRRAARSVFGIANVRDDLAPSMGAEDFAFIARAVPACYAWIGSGVAGQADAQLHNPRYDFNDEVIPLGVRYWVELAEAALAEPQ